MFIFEALKRYKHIGAIAPFSDSTIEKTVGLMQISHNANDSLTIVELGSGEGGFTKRLCETFIKSTIHAFEINEKFVEDLYELKYENLKVYPKSAEFVHEDIQHADIIISTLPFSIFDKQTIKAILQSSRTALASNGLFIIIQYSDYSSDRIHEIIGQKPVYSDRSIKNIPPAKLFVYKK